jgi:hypothetical protein
MTIPDHPGLVNIEMVDDVESGRRIGVGLF